MKIRLLWMTLFLLPVVLFAQDMSNVEIKTEKISDGVYMLTGRGGNIGVCIGEDGVFVIDDQFAPLHDKIVEAIRTLSDKEISFVLNTHWHQDHTGGNEAMSGTGAVIVAHDNVRKRMSSEQFIKQFQRNVPPAPAAALPVVTFSEEVTFHLNGQTIHVRHVPHAHTDGDGIVFFQPANVVHMGDTFFNGNYPFIDLSSGGSLQGVIETVNSVLESIDDETVIIPGHGIRGDKAALTAYRDMLHGVRDAVAPLVKAGKSVDEIAEADPLKPWNEKWGNGFMKPADFLGIVVESLGNGK
jgi:glyoxylase-like metal-dependent hydrolase (beta-lactamase superfamily II)